MNNVVMYRYEMSIRIIADDRNGKEVFVDLDELKWKDDGDGYEYLTLGDISDQLKALKYERVFYVWWELGLRGEIYEFGNHDPSGWVKHGETKGYA